MAFETTRLLNGLRQRPEAGTSGWYIWGGTTMSEAADFFDPLHHRHIAECCPAALPFLAPPGWRFLVSQYLRRELKDRWPTHKDDLQYIQKLVKVVRDGDESAGFSMRNPRANLPDHRVARRTLALLQGVFS